MCLALRRKGTAEILLCAGGVWDRWERKYTKDKPSRVVVADIIPSQIPVVRWYAEFLHALRLGLPRDAVMAAMVGGRRGGKTVAGTLCTCAFVIDLPSFAGSSSIAWMVSASFQDRDELDRILMENIPGEWFTPRGSPEFRYYWANGAVIRNISAAKPEALKRGRVDCLFYNEAQKMPVQALANGIMGTVDKGGITLLAGNPPDRKKGDWLRRLREAVVDERIAGIKLFDIDPKDNPTIEKPSRKFVGDILRLVDPKAAARDDEGLWIPTEDKAYPHFHGKRNLGICPEDEFDITPALVKRKVYKPLRFFAGADFQRNPYNCCIVLRAFEPITDPVYVAIDEFMHDGNEDYLIDEIYRDEQGKGYLPEDLIVIGDSSGSWQNSQHSQGSDRDGEKGRVSFDFFKRRKFLIEPPRKKKTDRGDHPSNPGVYDRLNLVNMLLAKGRLIIDEERCPRLAEALRECELGPNGKPRGQFSHITDALGYALWWIEPAPRPFAKAPTKEGARLIPFTKPSGPRML